MIEQMSLKIGQYDTDLLIVIVFIVTILQGLHGANSW